MIHQEYGTRLAKEHREELMGVEVEGELQRELESLSLHDILER